jgi:hypothetical protein
LGSHQQLHNLILLLWMQGPITCLRNLAQHLFQLREHMNKGGFFLSKKKFHEQANAQHTQDDRQQTKKNERAFLPIIEGRVELRLLHAYSKDRVRHIFKGVVVAAAHEFGEIHV